MSIDGMQFTRSLHKLAPGINLTASEMSLLLFIGMACNDAGVDDPQAIKMSQEDIGRSLFMGERTVRMALKSLEERGLIYRKAAYWEDSGKRRWDTIFLNVYYLPKSEPPAKFAGSVENPKSEPPAKFAGSRPLPAKSAGNAHRQDLPVIDNLATTKHSGTAIAVPEHDPETLDIGIPPSTAETLGKEFDQWYGQYPKQAGRAHALRAFKAARKKIAFEELMGRTKLFASLQKSKRTDPDYIQRPDKWLTGEHWEDEELNRYAAEKAREDWLWNNASRPAAPVREPLPVDPDNPF